MAEGTIKMIKDSDGLRWGTRGDRIPITLPTQQTDRVLGEGPFPVPTRNVVVKDIWPETRRIVVWATQPAVETIRAREFGRFRLWDAEEKSVWCLDVSPLYDFDDVADYIQRMEE